MKRKQRGITLIALVITIIVLLILAAVSISTLTGENGILTQATKASEETEMARIKEEAEIYRTELLNEQYLGESEKLNNYRLIIGLNAYFKDSVIQGGAVVVENNKYDVIVYDELQIKVQKHEELVDGDISVDYEKYYDENNDIVDIEFYVRIGGTVIDYSTFAEAQIRGKTIEEKGEIFVSAMNYYAGTSFENVQAYLEEMYNQGGSEIQLSSFEEFLDYMEIEISEFDFIMISQEFVKPEEFDKLYEETMKEYDNIEIINMQNQNVTSLDFEVGTYVCEEIVKNGVYNFEIKYKDKVKNINVNVDEIKVQYANDDLVIQYEVNDISKNCKVPIYESDFETYYDYTIDWGDGTVEKNGITHKYTKKGNYRAIITGVFKYFYMHGGIFNEDILINRIVQWGNTNLEEVYIYERGYGTCYLEKIAQPSENSFANLKSFKMHEPYIKEIPENLFKNAPNITSFVNLFNGCWNLAKIPKNIFNNCPNISNITDFSGAFQSCISIEKIPEELFAKSINAKKFSSTFSECTSLSEIPENLFKNCINAENFSSTFSECTSLSEIPENLFENNKYINNFRYTFSGCNGIVKKFPELWKRGTNSEGNDYKGNPDGEGCFSNCANDVNIENYQDVPFYWSEDNRPR